MARSSAPPIVEVAPLRFGLSDVEAAGALGIGVTLFKQMTEDGRMPRPRVINSRKVWDVDDVRLAFKRLPYDGEDRAVADDPFQRVVP